MRRVWLVAVFALSLFFGTGAYAFGVAASASWPAEAAQVTEQIAQADTGADTAHTSPLGNPGSPPQNDTGSNDRVSDMPECLDVAIAPSPRGAALHPPSPPLAQDLTPPELDGPQRPPRGLPVSAA